jgi:hypothetical protein
MRSTIRQLLVEGVAAVGGRVFEPHAATVDTPKPFIVTREGVQDQGAPWASFSSMVEVWPYVEDTSFKEVDGLLAAIKEKLHRARFAEDGEQYLADYEGTAGQEMYDTEWQALTKPMRFRVFSLGWLSGATYNPDPVAALQSWTGSQWPDMLHTDPATWAPDDTKPGIYWRLVTAQASELTNWGAWIEARLRAHIVAPGHSTRLKWTRQLVEGLALQRDVALSDGSPLLFGTVAGDSEADPMRLGQISLTARFGVLKDRPTPPTLNRASYSGAVQGEVT